MRFPSVIGSRSGRKAPAPGPSCFRWMARPGRLWRGLDVLQHFQRFP